MTSLTVRDSESLTALLVMAALTGGILFAIIGATQGRGYAMAETLSMPFPDDIPLLTPEANAEARETGRTSFRIGAMTYIVENLPKRYM